MDIILYSTHCPRCIILEKKLQQKNVNFQIVTDVNEMQSRGFMSAPVLEVDGKTMDFVEANAWVNNQEG